MFVSQFLNVLNSYKQKKLLLNCENILWRVVLCISVRQTSGDGFMDFMIFNVLRTKGCKLVCFDYINFI